MSDLSAQPASFLSDDRLLGGQVRLRQPVDGFRAAIDPVLLAASIDADHDHDILELGCGTGAAAVCVARRLATVKVTGLELQPDLARIAELNVGLNGFIDRIRIVVGDVRAPPPALVPGGFDHVLANPPYLEAGTASLPADEAHARSVGEGEVGFDVWVACALAMVRPRAPVTFIHRADRLDDILRALARGAGDITVFPLWPMAGRPAKRILVRARRGVKAPTRLLAGLTLHEADGKFTPAAEAILRDGAPLPLT